MWIAVALIVLAVFGMLAWQVDDWSRDLTTNLAATSFDATDASLRSLELSASVGEVRAAISRFVEQTERWEVGSDEEANDKAEAEVVLLVHTSRLFRFADDVHVYLQTSESATRVDVTSQSRIGKGDLGQNPRNIRELLQGLRNRFATPVSR